MTDVVETSTTDWQGRGEIGPKEAKTNNNKEIHLTKWMPFTDHFKFNVYNNRCPKLFVLYVLNCTVSKLHF